MYFCHCEKRSRCLRKRQKLDIPVVGNKITELVAFQYERKCVGDVREAHLEGLALLYGVHQRALNWHVPWRTNLNCLVPQIRYAPSSNLVNASRASSEEGGVMLWKTVTETQGIRPNVKSAVDEYPIKSGMVPCMKGVCQTTNEKISASRLVFWEPPR